MSLAEPNVVSVVPFRRWRWANIRFQSNSTVIAHLQRRNGTTDTTFGSAVVPGITGAPGQMISVRFEVTGTDPTQLRLKVWPAGTAEPGAWLLTASDADAALQVAGNVGVSTYLSGSSTNAPLTVSIDNLLAVDPTAPVDAAPVARFSTDADRLVVDFNGNPSIDDGTIVSYSWNFGDGTPAGSGATIPDKTYAAPGTYVVVLTVTDNGGQTGQMTANVTVDNNA